MTLTMRMPPLRIGELVAEVPIVQGGMGVGVSLTSLASAVADAGGIGVLSAIGLGFIRPQPGKSLAEGCLEALRAEIRTARQKTRGILGMNAMVASTNFEREVDTAIEEGIDVLFAGAGLPLDLPARLIAGAKTKLVPIVSSARAAALLIKRWRERHGYTPDALVVEGPMAGGHLGFSPEQVYDPDFALEHIVPPIIEEAHRAEQACGRPVPVIAGGGIFTGYDIARFLAMGAAGVQMGTRFVATCECDAAEGLKQAFVDCKEEDIMLIKSPVGMPGRAIRGPFLDQVEQGNTKPVSCPFQCLKTCDYTKSPYCICKALIQAQRGNLERGFAFAGQNAHRVTGIVPVRSLIAELQEQYAAAVTAAAEGV